MNTLLNQLDKIFKSVFEDNKIQVELTTSAKDIGQWNSLNHVLLISEIEKEFEISFELDEMIGFKDVGDIIKAIQSKKK
ncbi:MAG: hypothetical protein A3K10_00775 [Bacteroidetes bacterium RIFCSPLOWO2_12_FULL_31_6]|nr:MAG: hypothetical protein A3K10_00775 [Bacteroidetes bacterium RIFCSPLOWO2_12_FULL_31_6]